MSILQKAGFVIVRTNGSHTIMERAGATVSVPVHAGKDIKRGLLLGIIKQAGLTKDEFQEIARS